MTSQIEKNTQLTQIKTYDITAVGVVIGVIISNLKTGLSKMASGVGNGLKQLGKKTRSDTTRYDRCNRIVYFQNGR